MGQRTSGWRLFDTRACEVDEHMIRDEEGWKGSIRVIDPT